MSGGVAIVFRFQRLRSNGLPLKIPDCVHRCNKRCHASDNRERDERRTPTVRLRDAANTRTGKRSAKITRRVNDSGRGGTATLPAEFHRQHTGTECVRRSEKERCDANE